MVDEEELMLSCTIEEVKRALSNDRVCLSL